jgi:hypothetical protein
MHVRSVSVSAVLFVFGEINLAMYESFDIVGSRNIG